MYCVFKFIRIHLNDFYSISIHLDWNYFNDSHFSNWMPSRRCIELESNAHHQRTRTTTIHQRFQLIYILHILLYFATDSFYEFLCIMALSATNHSLTVKHDHVKFSVIRYSVFACFLIYIIIFTLQIISTTNLPKTSLINFTQTQ